MNRRDALLPAAVALLCFAAFAWLCVSMAKGFG